MAQRITSSGSNLDRMVKTNVSHLTKLTGMYFASRNRELSAQKAREHISWPFLVELLLLLVAPSGPGHWVRPGAAAAAAVELLAAVSLSNNDRCAVWAFEVVINIKKESR